MIIRSLQAQHFVKYEELLLNNLPDDLIVIAGQDTTGKSSILHALIFSLFGKSPNCDELSRLIRWGSDYLQTRVVFQCQGQSYYITRALNQEGKALANLYQASNQTELANSPEQVADVFEQLTGLTYNCFITLCYYPKDKLSSPLNDPLIHALANVQAYQQLNLALEQERASHTQNSEQLEHQSKHLSTAKKDQQPAEDEGLVKIHEELLALCQHHDDLSDQIGEEVMHYHATHESYWQAKLGMNKVRAVSHVFYLLGIGLAIVAAVLWLFPDYLSVLQDWSAISLAGGAGLLLAMSALLFVFSGIRIIQALYPLQRRSGVLSQRLFEAVRLQKYDLSYSLSPSSQQWYQQQKLPELDRETFADAEYLESWSGGVEQYDIAPTEVLDVSQALRVNLAARHQRLLNLVRLLEQDFETQQVQKDQHVSLVVHLNKSDEQLEGVTQQEHTALVAQALLSRVQLKASHELNEQLSQYFEPLFKESMKFDQALILQVLNHAQINLRSPVALSAEQQLYVQWAVWLVGLKAWQSLPASMIPLVCFDALAHGLSSSQSERFLSFARESVSSLGVNQAWWIQGDVDRPISAGLLIPCRLGRFDLISS